MSMATLILVFGLLYTILVGLLAFLRRESLSAQFAIESIGITAIFSGLAAFTSLVINPVVFLVLLYLVTMRVRLLVDLGNSFARHSNFETTEKIYAFIFRLKPDRAGRQIVEINRGALFLHRGFLDRAIGIFKGILENASQDHLGTKYEAAVHYNLGMAYRRKDLEAQAIAEFEAVLDTWPTSEYAPRSRSILAHYREKNDLSDLEENISANT